MSADRWSECPRCRERASAEANARREAARKAYGKVTAEQYEEMQRRADEANRPELDDTLREDYEFCLIDGGVHVSYRSRCESCGFDGSFTHDHKYDAKKRGAK